MKKLFLTLVVALVSVAASAQLYVGGEVGYWRDYQANQTEFSIAPEVGYNLSDKWALGLSFGYVHNYVGDENHLTDGTKINAVTVNPYARFTYAKFGPVKLFLDGGFNVDAVKVKDADDSSIAWGIGVKPGVSVNLTEKVSFVAHVGFLGFQDADDDIASAYKRGFGFDIDGNKLQFGLYYNF